MNQPGEFTIVKKVVWEEMADAGLSDDARLLFMWSWTNRLANVAGLYVAPPVSLREPFKDGTDERVHAALHELAIKPFVFYDFDACLLWVVRRAHHAGTSPKVWTRIRSDLQMAPKSPLRHDFITEYGAKLNGAS